MLRASVSWPGSAETIRHAARRANTLTSPSLESTSSGGNADANVGLHSRSTLPENLHIIRDTIMACARILLQNEASSSRMKHHPQKLLAFRLTTGVSRLAILQHPVKRSVPIIPANIAVLWHNNTQGFLI